MLGAASTKAEAETQALGAAGAGLPAGVVESEKLGLDTDGSYIVFAGGFQTEEEANAAAEEYALAGFPGTVTRVGDEGEEGSDDSDAGEEDGSDEEDCDLPDGIDEEDLEDVDEDVLDNLGDIIDDNGDLSDINEDLEDLDNDDLERIEDCVRSQNGDGG